jgi:hypothetical protein
VEFIEGDTDKMNSAKLAQTTCKAGLCGGFSDAESPEKCTEITMLNLSVLSQH